MIISAIDFSMTSPAICVYDTSTEIKFDNCIFYNISNIKKKPYRKNIHYTEMPFFKCDEERFDILSNWALEAIQINFCKNVIMEGYSFGSKSSRIFQIGENGGVLKHKLYINGISIKLIPPTEVKKHFNGKGNANKDGMIDSLKTQENITLSSDSKSPTSDIVDAYAILKTGIWKGLYDV